MERRRTAITSINRKDRLQVLPQQPFAENLGPRLLDDEKEGDKKPEEVPGYFSVLLGKFVRHHERLRERYLPLEDYYITSLVSEFLCFFLLVFFPSDFTGVNSGDGASLIAENRIPILFLLAIFSQFLLIMMDRVIWIRKWITFKIILQYALVFIYHFWLFFWLPFKNGRPFVRSPALVIFYLLKCWYFYWNSKQISVGFPLISANSLTKQYGLFNYAVFQIYRAIPFVYELRTLLDWACLPTTLDWFQWLKVEDIYSNLYIIQCRNAGYKREGRKLGDTQAWYMKLGIGVGVVLLICLIVWFPLFILSGANPTLASNPAVKLKLSLSFSGYASFYSAEQDSFTFPDLNHWNNLKGNYSFLEEDDRNNIQMVQVPTYSESRWLMTPPGISEMVQTFRNALRDPTKPRPTLIMTYTFTRNKTAAALVLTGESSVQIKDNATIAALIRVLDSTDNHQQSMNITIPNLFRRFMRLPLTGDPVVIENKQNNYVNVSISLTREYKNEIVNNISYPSLMTYWNAVQDETDPVYRSDRITLYPISLEVPTFLAGLVSVGIIGLYVGVVLTIGRFIRLMFVDLMPQIMFMDLEEPKKLLEFCEDINIVRNYVPFNTPEMKQMKMRIKNYFGGKRWIAELNNSELGQNEVFQLEEQMYYQLVDIYKNPNKLIKVTKFKND